jgi:hypothetical protein
VKAQRDKYSQSFYTVFICSCLILVVLDFCLIGAGSNLADVPIFHRGELTETYVPVMAAVIFFSLLNFMIAAIGIYIIKSPPHNFCVLAYGCFVFFFGFIPMMAQGGAMMAMLEVDSDDISLICNMSQDELEMENKLIYGLFQFAHHYDQRSE